MPETPITIAIVNTNPDLVRLLRVNLEGAGFVVVVLHIEDIKLGAASVEELLRQLNPRVVVYDLAPPYGLNWRTLDVIRVSPAFKGRRFVLTTVNLDAVQRLIGPEETVYEVVGEASDVAEVVRAVREASRARSTR